MPQPQIHHTSISTALRSLRSECCWGSGDLGCLQPLADIAEALGIGQIEITDIRDSAAVDSSIYPAFIDLRPLGTLANRSKDAEYRQRAVELEALPVLDLSKVYNAKMHFLHEKFLTDGGDTLSSDGYHTFWRANRSWLETYTVFCTLRHKYGTGNSRYWAEPDYQRLLTDVNFIKEYSADLRFHLYVQYILQMQWEDARVYAGQKGVELSARRGSSEPSLRQWWSGLDGHARREYYNNSLGLPGQAPEYLSGWEMEAVIRHKLSESSGTLTLPLRDWLGITRLEAGDTPRMAMALEDILAHKALLAQIRKVIEAPGK